MNNSSKVLVALVAGMAAGAALGIVFAPNKGAKTRKGIKKKVKKMADGVEDAFNKGKDTFNEMKEKMEYAVKEKVDFFS